MKKTVLVDFYSESNIKDNNIIVVKPRGFNKDNDTVDVRQYIIELAVQQLLDKGEIVEGNFEVQVY